MLFGAYGNHVMKLCIVDIVSIPFDFFVAKIIE